MEALMFTQQFKMPQCRVRHIPWKRAFDVVFSLAIMLLGLPIFLLISFLIMCTSEGNPFYSHTRVGRGGRPFRCYKFRTMYVNADERLEQLLKANPKFHKEWKSKHKLQNDPRITFIGKFLRRTSLDELPQFWNVLIGDLSIVGPRPVVPIEVHRHMGHKAAYILSVRPGLTGLWQVFGRSNTSYKYRIKLDEKYIRKQTFSLDLFLIIKTLPVMIFARGAY